MPPFSGRHRPLPGRSGEGEHAAIQYLAITGRDGLTGGVRLL